MATKTKTGTATTAFAEAEPDFEQLSEQLAIADAKARSMAADAGQARAERSTVAVSAIKAAYREKVSTKEVRARLLAAGVLKGTVSKIVTVVGALNDRTIDISDVKSLNGAYSLVKTATAAPKITTTSGPITPEPEPAATPVKPVTPEQALKIIIASIKAEKDPDKAFKLGGEWITRITNEITDALKSVEEEE